MKINSYYLFVKAFGSKVRLDIINLLKKEPSSVLEICRKLKLEQSRVSHNLKCLLDCGFVTNNRYGKKKIYSINKTTVLPVLKSIDKHVEKYYSHLLKCGVIKEEVS